MNVLKRGIDFDRQIVEALILVCTEIKVQTVNMKKNQLVIPRKKDFQHVIAVGGLALSRGLALEGLSIVYFKKCLGFGHTDANGSVVWISI